jgi:hypothetical protein
MNFNYDRKIQFFFENLKLLQGIGNQCVIGCAGN